MPALTSGKPGGARGSCTSPDQRARDELLGTAETGANGITLKPNKACDCALWDPKYLESKGQENRTLLRDDFVPTPGRAMELLCLE